MIIEQGVLFLKANYARFSQKAKKNKPSQSSPTTHQKSVVAPKALYKSTHVLKTFWTDAPTQVLYVYDFVINIFF